MRIKRETAMLTGLAALLAAALFAVLAVAEWLRYSPYGDPGALDTGIQLAAVALLFTAYPVGLIFFGIVVPNLRGYSRWKRTLSPERRFELALAEAAGMELLHQELKHHHREVEQRLTESVMGGPLDGWTRSPNGAWHMNNWSDPGA